MNSRTMDLNDSNNTVPKEKLLEKFRMVMSDTEELLRVTAKHSGVEAAAIRGRIQENLKVVKNSMFAAESAMIGYAREAENVTDRLAHNNVRYWY